MALEREQQTYERELSNLLKQEGKYVLIRGDEVEGVWETYQDALQAGYQKFGLSPFMVKRIQGLEQVMSFTRDLRLCPS